MESESENLGNLLGKGLDPKMLLNGIRLFIAMGNKDLVVKLLE
jgi:hypothetical protein